MIETVCRAPDGFPLAVQTAGPTDAPALLLLQGQANSHVWWDGLRDDFEDEFRTITLDYRGTGRSRGPVAAWSTGSFAADAACVLDHLGVGTTAVYGTSMGGRVAQMLAIGHPERVSALVLAGTSPGGVHAVERSPEVRRSIARASGAERTHVLGGLFVTPHGTARSTLLGDPTMTPQETAAHLRVSDRHDAWDALTRITAPTLVLHGGQDVMVPVDNAQALAGRIPGAQLQLSPQGRHGFFDEFSAEVTPAVLAFLRANPTG